MDRTANPPDEHIAISVLDPELPFLAAQAAIELDKLRLGEQVELSAVHRLGKLIMKSTSEQAAAQPQSLLDPPTISAINDAIGHTGAHPRTTVGELMEEAKQIASCMSRLSAQDDEALERVRQFCVVLSQGAVAFQRSIRQMRPSHPYRS